MMITGDFFSWNVKWMQAPWDPQSGEHWQATEPEKIANNCVFSKSGDCSAGYCTRNPQDRKKGFLGGGTASQLSPSILLRRWEVRSASVLCCTEVAGVETEDMANTAPISSSSLAGPSATTSDADGSSSAGAAPLLARRPDSHSAYTHKL